MWYNQIRHIGHRYSVFSIEKAGVFFLDSFDSLKEAMSAYPDALPHSSCGDEYWSKYDTRNTNT